ncbi:MAG: response regulator [Acidobacteria bacterium]|nr:response regulator [Acidobacteriota bacterium]
MQPNQSARLAVGPWGGDYRNLKVLIVDDSSVNRRIAGSVLERLGCETNFAYNGLQAIAAMGERRFDLVLMDLHMPEMDGFDAVRQIRAHETGPIRTVIVALSGEDSERYIHGEMPFGFDDALHKPLRIEDLLEVLERQLRQSHP